MKMRGLKVRIVAALCLTALLLCVGLATAATEGADMLRRQSSAFTAIAKKAVPGVVFIRVEKTTELNLGRGGQFFFNDPSQLFGDEFMQRFFGGQAPNQPSQPRTQKYTQVGQGSGFIITKDGYILTNNHVVGDADRITVRLADGRELEAKRIGSDAKSEVALIKIEGGVDLPYLELGDSAALEIGEWVIAIGNPFGLNETVTAGIVSAKGRSNIGIADYENFIQTDAAINPGNSGGPLLNIDAQVVGINTAIYSQSGGYMGIGFAIPINMAKSIKDQLLATGKVVRGYLGVYIQDMTGELAESFGLEKAGGILVSDVMKDTPAEKAGLRQGDVIVKVDGQAVENTSAFRNDVAATKPGTKVRLSVVRDGKERDVTTEVGTLPGDESEQPDAVAEGADLLGLTVEELGEDAAGKLGYKPGEGVLVAGVEEGSPAWRAELRTGNLITSVNRTPVKDVAAFRKAVAAAKSGRVLLLVKAGPASRFITIETKKD